MRMFPTSFPITRQFLDSSAVIELDTLIIAAPGARKYEINQNPVPDRENILKLLSQIAHCLRPSRVILFSTIDVYKHPLNVDEDVEISTDLTYGGNRALFEIELQKLVPTLLVRRLPGLFGSGLRKNLIFDLVNSRHDQLSNYSPDSIFQYIHIEEAIKLSLNPSFALCEILNVVTPPVQVSEFADLPMNSELERFEYNVLTKFDPRNYFFERSEVIKSIQNFIHKEKNARLARGD